MAKLSCQKLINQNVGMHFCWKYVNNTFPWIATKCTLPRLVSWRRGGTRMRMIKYCFRLVYLSRKRDGVVQVLFSCAKLSCLKWCLGAICWGKTCCPKRDKFAVKLLNDEETVGHLPREYSRITRYFLARGGSISVKVSGPRRRCKQLCGEMEIFCRVTFTYLRKAMLNRLKALLTKKV